MLYIQIYRCFVCKTYGKCEHKLVSFSRHKRKKKLKVKAVILKELNYKHFSLYVADFKY